MRSFLEEPVEEVILDGRDGGEGGDEEDVTLQPTRPDMEPDATSSPQLRPYHMQRYREFPAALSPSTSGAIELLPTRPELPRPTHALLTDERVTGQLVPAAQQLEPPAATEAKRRHELYVWLVLIVLFLLVVLGGIGLDALIASYRW